MRRVVVTGLGMINCVGQDKESSFKAIVNGECGIKSITLFDASNQTVRIAGEITDFDPKTVMNPKEVKKADRFIQLGIKAAKEAMVDASFDTFEAERFGISSASGGSTSAPSPPGTSSLRSTATTLSTPSRTSWPSGPVKVAASVLH